MKTIIVSVSILLLPDFNAFFTLITIPLFCYSVYNLHTHTPAQTLEFGTPFNLAPCIPAWFAYVDRPDHP